MRMRRAAMMMMIDDDDDDNDNGDDMKGEVEYKDNPHPSCCSVRDKVVCSHKDRSVPSL